MTEKILFVDDESNVLSALQRQFRKNYDVSIALGGVKGIQMISSEGPFAVIVSDMQMPEMNGLQVLRKAKELAPDSVRLMLTGNADQKTAMDAVNEGCVFSFLTKPCSPEVMVRSINAAVEQHRLLTAERELLEGTLNGSIKLLMDMLSMVAPDAFGRTVTIQDTAMKLAKAMQLENTWNLEMASMLCNIACVTLPPETLAKTCTNMPLSPEEQVMITRLPETGKDLITNIPRLEQVAKIVLYQQKQYNGGGFPEDSCSGDDIPRESRILKVLCDLEALKANGLAQAEALERMAGQAGCYDPVILKISASVLGADDNASSTASTIEIRVSELAPGHVLISDIQTIEGKLLMAAGNRLTLPILERLHNYHKVNKIREPIQVLSAEEEPEPAEQEEAVAV